jgi:hypothetical protein
MRDNNNNPIRPGAQATSNLLNARTMESGIKVPEQLVGMGFRCWLAGYDSCDIQSWGKGWNYYSSVLGPRDAKGVVAELACWVRCVHSCAARKIEVHPHNRAGFCLDECVAISMVAASQHSACPALWTCAFTLLGTSEVDEVLDHAANFGSVLRDAGQVLSQTSICDTAILAQAEAPTSSALQH